MADKHQGNIKKYTAYYTDIIRGLDVLFQEDQLMRTKLWFPLVPAPMYMPSMHEMENDALRKIKDTAWDETKRIEKEMLIIMSEDQKNVD